MTDLTDALWRRYRIEGDLEARGPLLEQYLGLVHHVARQMKPRVSDTVEIDDLVSAGTIGLVQALEGFDLDRGLAFSTFAVRRVRGAMLDELRSRDWVPRSVRARARQISVAVEDLERTLGRSPEPNEIARALGVDLATYWKWREDVDGAALLSLEQAPANSEDGLPLEVTLSDPDAPEPMTALAHEETLDVMRENLAAMPERDRMVLSLYFYEELTLREIADILHLTESRVSQIRTKALKRLRESMMLVGEGQ